ncbi:hypothetical protein [Actinomadura macra]|nr:hypothetical protein [Actinomadura macra]
MGVPVRVVPVDGRERVLAGLRAMPAGFAGQVRVVGQAEAMISIPGRRRL